MLMSMMHPHISNSIIYSIATILSIHYPISLLSSSYQNLFCSRSLISTYCYDCLLLINSYSSILSHLYSLLMLHQNLYHSFLKSIIIFHFFISMAFQQLHY